MNSSSFNFVSAARLAVLSGALLFGGAARESQAATITWGAATTISGDGNVQTAGTKVGAFNLGAANVPTTTVNGVIFDPFAVTGNSITSGNFTLDSSSPFSDNARFGTTVTPFNNLSTSYKTLLRSGTVAFNNGSFTLTMRGLASGTNYSFQWWTNSSADTFNELPPVVASSGNSVTVDPNTTNTAGGVGQFAIGTFTADSATQVVTFSGQGNRDTILTAFQLRSGVAPVPEPSTYAMMFLGVGALGLMTRRKRGENSRL